MSGWRKAGNGKRATGWIAGCGVAAFLLLMLSVGVSRLVVLWCPRGDDCERVGQLMFWTGLAVSAAISISLGLVVRDLVDRWTSRRPT